MSTTVKGRKVGCIGEAMIELKLDNANQGVTTLGFAGDTLNTAVYLKRLMGGNSEVAYVTALGKDSLSKRMFEFIESESIVTDSIQRSEDRQIGLYAIDNDAQGERSFSYWRGQSAARTLFQSTDGLNFDVLAQYDTLCFSAITLAILPASVRSAFLEALSQIRQSNGVTLVFDSNYRPALWESEDAARSSVAAAWRITDIALPSLDDEQSLFQEKEEGLVLDRLRSYGLSRGALKRGSSGPLSLSDQTTSEKAQFDAPTKIIDTTAAGDSFNAGYLSAVLTGLSEHEALSKGHDCALRVIAHSGAIVPPELW